MKERPDNRGADALVEVFASIDPTRARIARDMLEGAGIECFVFDREASRIFGSTPAVPVRLMVYAEEADEAKTRLGDLGLTG